MSLRWRLLGAFFLVIVLTIVLTSGVAYWTTQRNLREFVTQIGEEEALFLSDYLSNAYTKSDGWETLIFALADVGYIWNEVVVIDAIEMQEGDFPLPLIEAPTEIGVDQFASFNPSRLVVVDTSSQVLFDSYRLLEPGSLIADLPGVTAPIFDLKNGETVGSLYVTVEEDFLVDESTSFLIDTVRTTFWGGLLTAVIASVLALWLAGRITAPVTALTKATEALVDQNEPTVLPVRSNDELGQMTAAFNQMTAALQTQRDLRKRLINDVSHELNTPLSVIQLEAKGLKDGLQSQTEAADQIMREVGRLHNLVHDLNWLAETDSKELHLALEPVNVAQLLVTEMERWEIPAQTQQVKLQLGDLPTLPEIRLDRKRMSQVLGNILRNGLQHTSAGGTISVEAKIASDGESGGQQVVISISDDGAGIDLEELPHLFERFYRTDRSRSRHSGGSGLGLSISQAIVTAHGGKISISSGGLGKGASVQIGLPIAQDEAQ